MTGYDVFVGTHPGAEGTTPANGAAPIVVTDYNVLHLDPGQTYYFTVRALSARGASAPSTEVSNAPGYRGIGSLAIPVVSLAPTPDGLGYWLVNSAGQVSTHGDAVDHGSVSELRLAAPIVQIVASRHGGGYWLVGTDGGVFAFGDARFFGSTGSIAVQAPVVGMAVDPATGGYWLVTNDGQVFGFDTPVYGSPPVLDAPVIGIEATADGGGYWEVAPDGGVFAYGDARFRGSPAGAVLNAPIAGMSPDQADGGYWLVGWDGGIFAYGAPFHGAG